MVRKRSIVPSYLRHQGRNLARVRFKGRDYYLGEYESRESKRLYALFLRWIQLTDDLPQNWHELDPEKFAQQRPEQQSTSGGLTLVEVIAQYLRFAEVYYQSTVEVENIRYSLKPVRQLFGDSPATKFGPNCLR